MPDRVDEPFAGTSGPVRMGEPRRTAGVRGFLLGLLTASTAAAVVYWLFASGGSRAPDIDASRLTVVRQIQQLARLETVLFGMDKIVSGGQETRFFPKFLAGDRLLLMAYGEVTAGVDLGRLDEAGVSVSGRTVRLHLPEPEVFATRIDNERTRVYSRQTGLFTSVDPTLESEVRREAERQIRQAALDGGILQVAAGNARTTLDAFVRAVGFERVEIQ